MKKQILTLLAALVLLNGCSYFSWMNPWAEEEKTSNEATQFVPNQFLWQASLDKLKFMGIKSEEKALGKMVTDWWSPKGKMNEQFKLKVNVLSSSLRADCLKVVVYKQVWRNGHWIEDEPNAKMAGEIELAILAQARVLYRKSLEINEN